MKFDKSQIQNDLPFKIHEVVHEVVFTEVLLVLLGRGGILGRGPHQVLVLVLDVFVPFGRFEGDVVGAALTTFKLPTRGGSVREVKFVGWVEVD